VKVCAAAFMQISFNFTATATELISRFYYALTLLAAAFLSQQKFY